MISDDDKEKFLEQLANLPIVSSVCKKMNIHRSTIYRWLESDPVFTKKYNLALGHGRENINDLAESKLIGHINNGEPWAIRHWLDSNSPRYRKPRKAVSSEPPRQIHTVLIEVVDKEKDQKIYRLKSSKPT